MGQQFQDLHARHLKLLEWQGPPHPLLSTPGEQARHYHLVLPSFFHLLESLHQEGRQFAVVFRTFGTDLPRVLQAVHCALEGQHPHFPALQDISVSERKACWVMVASPAFLMSPACSVETLGFRV